MTAPGSPELTPVKRALLEVRELKARLAAAEGAAREPIAIVGAGLRLPGGIDDLERLWTFLLDGGDAVTEVPRDRWDLERYLADDADAPGKMTTRHGAFLDDVYRFDAELFGIAPAEAESMDPQQRIMLETAWRAFEDAGIAPTALHGSRTGVFVGVSNNDYGRMVFARPEAITAYFASGNAASVVAGRVSYTFGLRGPSLSVDTACSSSLTAVHLAVQSLRAGECDLALAGGINLILSPEINITFSKARMMAPDGRCKTFDAAADGYVRGEGCAVVALKRLRDCSPADRVLAVIRGTAINQDGRSGGLTAPNGPAQEAVVRAALQAADIDPLDVGYVEAHGTGTALGDPIEVHALGAVFGGRPPERRLAVGSIKTNLGHLEAAAGVIGLLKAALAVQRGEIPPHLHLRTKSPQIEWDSLPIDVPGERAPLPASHGRRIAGVSSFGFSGTNAHVVLESAATSTPVAQQEDRPYHVLALSARTPEGLAALAAAYAETLEDGAAPLADVCYTANTGRAHLTHRLTARGQTSAAIRQALRAPDDAEGVVRGAARATPRVAFLFTGGGAQSPGMGRALYEGSAVFRETFDRAAAIVEPWIGRSLREVIDAAGDTEAPVHENRYAQPATVVLEMALTALWRSWGITPAAVVGHSLGEYAAAWAAGALSMEDALRVVVERARLVDSLGGTGAMAALSAPIETVQQLLGSIGGTVVVAAVNGPEHIVVSGDTAAIERITASAAAQGIRASRLRVTYASHSPLMDAVLQPFETALASLQCAEPRVAFVSNLTGRAAGRDVIGHPSYWREHLRRPVRFSESIGALDAMGVTHFIEIGPHPVLVAMGADCVAGRGVWLSSLERERDDWDTILESVQVLHCDGAAIDWAGLDRGRDRRRVALPGYRFAGERFGTDFLGGPVGPAAATVDEWAVVTASLDRQADCAPIGVDVTGYAARWAALERLTMAHARHVIRAAGLFTNAGDQASAAEVCARLGADDRYGRLIGRWLARLAGTGDLRQQGDVFVSVRPLPEADLAAAWEESASALASNGPLLGYLRHCGSLLSDVLGGRQSPLETLFPGGRFDLADDLYRRSSTLQYVNTLAAAAVASVAAARPAPATLRVLEIGAGTGATTAAVLPVLPAGRTRYLFTDVSPVFLERARETLTGFPFVEFGIFDLDGALDGPGSGPAEYDLVIAANAVHASRNLPQALERLRRLLAPGGWLLLIESTADLAWFDMSTGLIEGWQHFDDELRREHPLLDARQWSQALRDAGFEAVRTWPGEQSAAADIGQHLITGRVAGRAALGGSLDGVPAAEKGAAVSESAASDVTLGAEIAAALPSERLDRLRTFVGDSVARVLKRGATSVPARDERLMDLGLDSLMAVRLRNLLGAGLGLDKPLPVSLMFDHPTIDEIANYLLTRLFPAGDAGQSSAGAPPSGPTLDEAALAAMSDNEVEALLLARLERK